MMRFTGSIGIFTMSFPQSTRECMSSGMSSGDSEKGSDSMGFVLGIDLGTTGTKSIIFDQESNIIGSGYRELPQIFPKPGWVEHDPVRM